MDNLIILDLMMYLLQFVIFVQRQRLSKLKTEPMTKDSLHEHSQPYDVTQAVKHCLSSTNNSPLISKETRLSAQIIKYNNIMILATYKPMYRNCLYTVPVNGHE